MSTAFSVPLSKIIREFNLTEYYLPRSADDILIYSTDLNRPGLEFAGFYGYFDNQRIQIIGKNELSYIEQFDSAHRQQCIREFLSKQPKALIITRGQSVIDELDRYVREYEVPVLITNDGTSAFMSGLISLLNVELAPRITRHGVLVEVYGEGILLLGDSGVGKSETAVELVKRGHRLIADDAVEIRKVSSRTLVGTSPDNIRHFVELRGVGIINARRIFGIGSVKISEKINMVVNLEHWDPEKIYDRMGMDEQYTEILGLKIPSATIPVKPGRNLAIIIEVAAMNNRQKRMGYNAAVELLKRLGMIEGMDMPAEPEHNDILDMY